MLAWMLRRVVATMLVCGVVVFGLAPGGTLDRFLDRGRPVQASPPRSAPVPNESVYRRSRDGHFYVDADVNGARIRFLIDTGATFVSLSPEDARLAGLRVFESDYTARTATANGVTRVAPVTASANARRTPLRTGSGRPRIVDGRPRNAAVSGRRSMLSCPT